MAHSVTKVVPTALAAALLLFLARPAFAACPLCGCMSWFTSPPPSLPVGSPYFGYNKTVWQAWPVACPAAQPAILAQPVPTAAPQAGATSRLDEWANARPNAGGRLPVLHPLVATPATSQPAAAGESPYHALEAVSAPAR